MGLLPCLIFLYFPNLFYDRIWGVYKSQSLCHSYALLFFLYYLLFTFFFQKFQHYSVITYLKKKLTVFILIMEKRFHLYTVIRPNLSPYPYRTEPLFVFVNRDPKHNHIIKTTVFRLIYFQQSVFETLLSITSRQVCSASSFKKIKFFCIP